MLFSFNDEFIAEMCGGLSDDDTLELFADGITAMHAVVEENLNRSVGHTVVLTAEGNEFVADLSTDEADREFGAPGVMINPSYRQGFIQAVTPAQLAFAKTVGADV